MRGLALALLLSRSAQRSSYGLIAVSATTVVIAVLGGLSLAGIATPLPQTQLATWLGLSGDLTVARWLSMEPEAALGHLLIAASFALIARPHPGRRRIIAAAAATVIVMTIALSGLGTHLSPLLATFGGFGSKPIEALSATLMGCVGIAGFLLTSARKSFEWEFGLTATAGFIAGVCLLILIGLTTIHSQRRFSETNLRLTLAETGLMPAARTCIPTSPSTRVTFSAICSRATRVR